MQERSTAITTVDPPAPIAAVNLVREPVLSVRHLNIGYGAAQALFDVNYDLFPKEILAFIGPSGCGKSTALKSLDRMLDAIPDIRIEGCITKSGADIYRAGLAPPDLRRQFGLVAQKPNPFVATVYENVAYGARINMVAADGSDMDAHVETCLRRAFL